MEVLFYQSNYKCLYINLTQLAIVFNIPLQLKLCSDESYKREQERKMFLCGNIQQSLWTLRLTILEGHWMFVHLTACFNPRCDVFSENGPPVVATCRSGHLKLPFDPQPYLGGINDGGMNKRAILIHLALSESPVRDLLQQMVRALITADWLSRTSPLHENGSVLNALMQFWFVFINALIAKLN